jgi:hypothetical protein
LPLISPLSLPLPCHPLPCSAPALLCVAFICLAALLEFI